MEEVVNKSTKKKQENDDLIPSYEDLSNTVTEHGGLGIKLLDIALDWENEPDWWESKNTKKNMEKT